MAGWLSRIHTNLKNRWLQRRANSKARRERDDYSFNDKALKELAVAFRGMNLDGVPVTDMNTNDQLTLAQAVKEPWFSATDWNRTHGYVGHSGYQSPYGMFKPLNEKLILHSAIVTKTPIGIQITTEDRQAIIAKWDGLGLLHGLSGQASDDICKLFENQQSWIINES